MVVDVFACRYCGGSHWSDECQKYKTVEDSKKILNGSCYIYLKSGNLSRECRIEKACFYCKKIIEVCVLRNFIPQKFLIHWMNQMKEVKLIMMMVLQKILVVFWSYCTDAKSMVLNTESNEC